MINGDLTAIHANYIQIVYNQNRGKNTKIQIRTLSL